MVSHYQNTSQRHCHHMEIEFCVNRSGQRNNINERWAKSRCPYFLLLRNGCNVAVEQWTRLEKKGGEEERVFEQWRKTLCMSTPQRSEIQSANINRKWQLCFLIGCPTSGNHHWFETWGKTDWWLFPWSGSVNFTVCQSLLAKVLFS